MKKSKYDIELNLTLLDLECDWKHCGDYGTWLGFDTLVAEGDTFEEILENATVSTLDQDGGEGPYRKLGDLKDEEYRLFSGLLAEKFETLRGREEL